MLAQLCTHPWSTRTQRGTKDTHNNNSDNMDSKKLNESSDHGSRQMNMKRGNGEIKTEEQNNNDFTSKFLIQKMKKLTLKSSNKSRSNQNQQQLKESIKEDQYPGNRPDIVTSTIQNKKQISIPSNDCICKDFESFLNLSSLQEPGNIPMVVIKDVVLRATGAFKRKDIVLAMGNVVNGIHKTGEWIFVQTAQGNDGYIPYNSCLPLGIRPPARDNNGFSHLAPWEINNQITHCSNQTDVQKLSEFNNDEDMMEIEKKNDVITVVCDYLSKNDKQISVRRGEIVTIIERKNDDWLKVRTVDGFEGLIPLAYTNVGKQLFL